MRTEFYWALKKEREHGKEKYGLSLMVCLEMVPWDWRQKLEAEIVNSLGAGTRLEHGLPDHLKTDSGT